jgi:hypothetical protein
MSWKNERTRGAWSQIMRSRSLAVAIAGMLYLTGGWAAPADVQRAAGHKYPHRRKALALR